jgi:hypothetical protein
MGLIKRNQRIDLRRLVFTTFLTLQFEEIMNSVKSIRDRIRFDSLNFVIAEVAYNEQLPKRLRKK